MFFFPDKGSTLPVWPKTRFVIGSYCQTRGTLYTYIHIRTYSHAYIHACMHACMHAYINACMHTHIHTCIHTCIRAYMHTSVHAHMHTCIHISYIMACMYMHPHTYIHTYVYVYRVYRISKAPTKKEGFEPRGVRPRSARWYQTQGSWPRQVPLSRAVSGCILDPSHSELIQSKGL